MNLLTLLIAAVIQPLWPEGKIPDPQPDQIAAPSQEVAKPGFDRAAHRMPYLEWCEPPAADVKTRACVILISGGSYQHTCDGPAMKNLERVMLKNGLTCVYLWYRTPRPKGLPIYQSAWQDGQRAVRLVRAAAKERGYDPEKIGVLGCSAGSHLSVLLGTSALTPAYSPIDAIDQLPCHINWALPMCPAYVLTDGIGVANTRQGDAIDVKLDACFKFDAKTCPMCLMHGGIDLYSPNASTQIYRQLRRMKIPAELHLDADRNHGVVSPAKFERAMEFMRQMGYLGKLAPEEKLMSRYPTDVADVAYEKQMIWPEGKMPDAQTNQVEKPFIEWYVPNQLTTKAIQIIYAGGGYFYNRHWDFEVAPTRRYLNAKGMSVVVMHYRSPRALPPLAKHTSAWQDLQRAIRLVRSQASSRGLDPNRIGIMGSSAGGHLTLMGATSSKRIAYWPIDELDRKTPCNVQWALAIYPAYALTDGLDVPNVNGGNEDDSRLAPEFSFDLATCPILFLHGDADGWAAMNSVKCWEQLRRMGIQGEVHTLATRGHCFQKTASPGTGSYTWNDRIWDFLTTKGFTGTTYAADALRPFVESGELPGAVSVFYKDGVQETCCIGYADAASKRRITIDDVYMQCSQTKGFCGVTIAKLVEDGKISLDDPVSKYLPEFKTLWVNAGEKDGVKTLAKAKNVLTIRMVMNHTGGFEFEVPFYNTSLGGWSRRAPLRSIAAQAAALPLKFEPGTSVQYSNVGIDIGAAVVEVVSGMRWEAFLKANVLDPLGMKASTFWPTDAQLKQKIELYDCVKGSPAKWREQNPSMARPYNDDRVFASAGAGLWTTVRDQLKFYKMLMNLGVGENGVRVLKEATVKSILATSTRPDSLRKTNSGYSLGLKAPFKDEDDDNAWFGHGGAWCTNCMVNWHQRQLKLWAVQLCGGPQPWNAARDKAAEAFFKAKLDGSGVDAYTGRMK